MATECLPACLLVRLIPPQASETEEKRKQPCLFDTATQGLAPSVAMETPLGSRTDRADSFFIYSSAYLFADFGRCTTPRQTMPMSGARPADVCLVKRSEQSGGVTGAAGGCHVNDGDRRAGSTS